MTDPTIPIDPTRCQCWAAGHRVHWVQGLRAANSGGYTACLITEADDDGHFTVIVRASGEELRLWHHDATRLRSLVDQPLVEINEQWWILRQNSLGHWSFRKTPSPCVFTEPSGPLHEQLQTHGGFSVSGPAALRMLADASDEDPNDDPDDETDRDDRQT